MIMHQLLKKIKTNKKNFYSSLIKKIDNNENFLLTYFNQHCFNIAWVNKNYKKVLNNFILYTDGFGIYLAIRLIFKISYKQFNATDFNLDLFNYVLQKKIKFFIIGGKFNENVIDKKLGEYKNVFQYYSGYFNDDEMNTLIDKIKKINPQIIFIGMGVPKQELIAYNLSKIFGNISFVCVGNFFEFYFENVSRITPSLRNKGVEWIYRLITEPKRLWKRYIIGIPIFSIRIIILKLKIIFS